MEPRRLLGTCFFKVRAQLDKVKLIVLLPQTEQDKTSFQVCLGIFLVKILKSPKEDVEESCISSQFVANTQTQLPVAGTFLPSVLRNDGGLWLPFRK